MTASRFSSRVKKSYRLDCLQISIDSLSISFLKDLIFIKEAKNIPILKSLLNQSIK
jgi:hypothetical protein